MTLDLNQILENLTQTAKEDGQISIEQEEFLSILRKDIELFQKSVNFAIQDDHISDDQLHDLIILRDRILTSSFQFSTDVEDVKNLVNELYYNINEFKFPGMDENDLSEFMFPEKDEEELPYSDQDYKPQNVTSIYLLGLVISFILLFRDPLLSGIWSFLFVIALMSLIDYNNNRLYQANIELKKLLDLHQHKSIN